MAQSLEIVRRRIDEAGTREPSIQRQGEDRILVQVPGVGSAEEVLALLGRDRQADLPRGRGRRPANPNAPAGPRQRDCALAEQPGRLLHHPARAEGLGENLVDASAGFDQDGRPAVNFRFDTTGARRFGDYTRQNVGRIFAIVLDGEVISAPRIISAITGGSGQITGSFTCRGQPPRHPAARRRAARGDPRAGAAHGRPGPRRRLHRGRQDRDRGRAGRGAGLHGAVSYGLFGLFATSRC
jgi:protein-export membrane protein SecD